MNDLIIFGLSIIIHEIGHYLAFLFLGLKPDIDIKFYQITVGNKEVFKVKLFEFYYISLCGILSGLWFLKYMDSPPISLIAYCILCSGDIVNLNSFFTMSKKELNMNMKQVYIKKLKSTLNDIENG